MEDRDLRNILSLIAQYTATKARRGYRETMHGLRQIRDMARDDASFIENELRDEAINPRGGERP